MFVKKRKIQVLGLLSHKNLAREVHMYGYHYSSKTHLFLILGAWSDLSAFTAVYTGGRDLVTFDTAAFNPCDV